MLPREWQVLLRNIARTVREVRGLLGWSQQTLADKALISQGAVSRLERSPGDSFPLYTAVRILGTLGAGAEAINLPVTPAAQEVLRMATLFTAPVTGPVPPDLVELLTAWHRLPPERRAPLLRLIHAANDLFGQAWTHQQNDTPHGA